MARKNVNTLAKELDFKSPTEYYDYMMDSHINGNFDQCRRLFSDLRKEDKKSALSYIHHVVKDLPSEKKIYDFYFDLL